MLATSDIPSSDAESFQQTEPITFDQKLAQAASSDAMEDEFDGMEFDAEDLDRMELEAQQIVNSQRSDAPEERSDAPEERSDAPEDIAATLNQLNNQSQFIRAKVQPVGMAPELQSLLQKGDDDEANFLPHLRIYYQRLFPIRQYYRWLSYGDAVKTFPHREFSFTLHGDIYIRFQSFKNAEELKSELLRLCPVKIDLGAVYNTKPKEKKTIRAQNFTPEQRELVFDIDMTDYDEIRTCCKGGDICPKCWEFMTVAIKVLDSILRSDMNFKHLLWVFSGRRGVHCWVCDEHARFFTQEQRKALVTHIEIIKGGEQQIKKTNLPNILAPHQARSQEILKKHFPRLILQNQDVLQNKDRWSKVLALVPDEVIRQQLEKQWTSEEESSTQRWKELVDETKVVDTRNKNLFNTARDIMFQYSYPRLDDKVTTGVNHLLKSPFCVHPKTGKVSVPILAENCEKFSPFDVPKLGDLIREIDAFDASHTPEECQAISDLEKTSLKPYMDLFENFVRGLEQEQKEIKEEKKRREEEQRRREEALKREEEAKRLVF